MSCDHQLLTQHLTDFIEGGLPPELQRQCQLALDNCPQCRESHRNAVALYQLAADWRDHEVPDWHRTRYAVKPRSKQGMWLNWAAMAMSCFAVILVVLRVEVSVDQGLLISFGGSQSRARTSELIAAQIETLRQEQELQVSTRLAEFTEDQATLTRLTLADWMQTNREERRDDLSLILSTWESQRYQDQRVIDERFDYLATSQFESDQFINDLVRNVNFSQRGNQ